MKRSQDEVSVRRHAQQNREGDAVLEIEANSLDRVSALPAVCADVPRKLARCLLVSELHNNRGFLGLAFKLLDGELCPLRNKPFDDFSDFILNPEMCPFNSNEQKRITVYNTFRVKKKNN